MPKGLVIAEAMLDRCVASETVRSNTPTVEFVAHVLCFDRNIATYLVFPNILRFDGHKSKL